MERSFGRYEIRGSLGAGGMGEVYRAWDPGLRREVAIKVLPEDVSSDRVRRRRFLEEARAVGALTHPHIVAVHDVQVDDPLPFIVTELIDGRQLREEMDEGPLPIAGALDLGVQIASALKAAHDCGITHRDLKPQNVMVTRDGQAKILDFGLAQTVSARSGDTSTLTGQGIAGTPQYMSPEQVRGAQEIDFRSDQFSFGVMLFEMVTGRHPFQRDTAVQTMAAIVAEPAAVMTRPRSDVPEPLRWVVERCLAKEPAERYAATADLVKDLTTIRAHLRDMAGTNGRRGTLGAGKVSGRVLTIASVAALVAVAVLVLPPPVAPVPTFRPLVTDEPFQGTPAWSTAGTSVAYVATVNAVPQIVTRRVDRWARPQPLTSSSFDATDPFWSRDDRRVYFHSLARMTESLWSVGAAGGEPQLVVENAARAALSPSGEVLAFFRETGEGQMRIGTRRALTLASADGSNVRRYMGPPFDTRTFVEGALRFSPDGTKLLAWVWGWSDARRNIPAPEFWIIPWPQGTPRRVLQDLSDFAPAPVSFDWFHDSRHIVIALWDPATTGMHLWLVDSSSGRRWPFTSALLGSENRPVISPDNRRIAFANEQIDFDLIEIPLDGTPARPLLATTRSEFDPTFAPDGQRYAHVSDRDGPLRIWLSTRDETYSEPIVDPAQFPGSRTLTLGALALSPDMKSIAYQRYADKEGYQVWVSSTGAAGSPVPLTAGTFYQDAPAWSPNSDWIAFIARTKDETGVLAKARVGPGPSSEIVLRRNVTLTARPKWSPDDRWILCDTADGLIILSPDGTGERLISEELWIAAEWSADSRHIYGLRESDDRPRHYMLVELDIATGSERIINGDVGVLPPASQPIRGLTRAGSALVTSVAQARSTIYVAEGVEVPRGRFDWFLRR